MNIHEQYTEGMKDAMLTLHGIKLTDINTKFVVLIMYEPNILYSSTSQDVSSQRTNRRLTMATRDSRTNTYQQRIRRHKMTEDTDIASVRVEAVEVNTGSGRARMKRRTVSIRLHSFHIKEKQVSKEMAHHSKTAQDTNPG